MMDDRLTTSTSDEPFRLRPFDPDDFAKSMRGMIAACNRRPVGAELPDVRRIVINPADYAKLPRAPEQPASGGFPSVLLYSITIDQDESVPVGIQVVFGPNGRFLGAVPFDLAKWGKR